MCRGIARPFAPVVEDIWEILVTIASLVGRGFVVVRPMLAAAALLVLQGLCVVTAGVTSMVLFICSQGVAEEMYKHNKLSLATMTLNAREFVLLLLLLVLLCVVYGSVLAVRQQFLRILDLLGWHSTNTESGYEEMCSEYLQIAFMDKINTVLAKLEERGEPIRLGLIRRGLQEMHVTGADRRALQAVAGVLDSLYHTELGNMFDQLVSEGEDPRHLIARIFGLN